MDFLFVFCTKGEHHIINFRCSKFILKIFFLHCNSCNCNSIFCNSRIPLTSKKRFMEVVVCLRYCKYYQRKICLCTHSAFLFLFLSIFPRNKIKFLFSKLESENSIGTVLSKLGKFDQYRF